MKRLTPIKAIRLKCLDCSGSQPSEVRKCTIPECPLFLYRFGKNPSRKGLGRIGGNSILKREMRIGNLQKTGIVEGIAIVKST